MKILFIGIVLMISWLTQAGFERGNGGDVIVCTNNAGDIVSVELLDFYEGRTPPRDIYNDLGGNDLNVEEKIDIVITRLSLLSPDRAKSYKQQSSRFYEDAMFLSGIELVDIPDSLHLAIPLNCKVEQIIVQQQQNFPEDKKFIVNKELWDRLDNNNKAGLILHEIIYSEALGFKHTNSLATRYFNSIISSSRLTKMNNPEFVKLLKLIKFNYVRINGAYLDLKTMPEFYSDGHLKRGCVVPGSIFEYNQKEYIVSECVEFYENRNLKKMFLNKMGVIDVPYKNSINKVPGIGAIYFDMEGQLKWINLKLKNDDIDNNRVENFEMDLIYDSKNINLSCKTQSYGERVLLFWPNGRYRSCHNNDYPSSCCVINKELILPAGNREFQLNLESRLDLFENGHIQVGVLQNEQRHNYYNGLTVVTPPDCQAVFNKEGSIIKILSLGWRERASVLSAFGKFSKVWGIKFYDDGLPSSFRSGEGREVNIQGRIIKVDRDKEITVYKSGKLKTIVLLEDTWLASNSGVQELYLSKTGVIFDENSLVSGTFINRNN